MNRRNIFLGAALALSGALAFAQAAPALDGPLRIVSGYAPGGSTDRVARIVADKLQAKLGVPVVVENKTGAGGRLAAQQVKNTPANQNVLMVGNPAVMVVAPLVFKDAGYDPQRDFVPVSHVNDYDFGLAVATAVPVKELSHLIAWMRANPEKSNFGVPATGSLPHFFALMTGEKAGVKAEVVGYRGSGPLITDLIGGQVPVAFDTFETLLPQHEGGKLRILAIGGEKRSPYAPQIPTLKEQGLNLVGTGWNALFAPASMPKEKVDLLSKAIHEVMRDPDTVKKFNDAKMTPVAATQAQTRAMLDAYRKQWAPVVQQSGYTP
ncbi:Bug family tripartite tricarboxylate transporter substrate binding protein [Ramlibacter rhizophilus]|uniref:ABC transporter substrate-binding protein n=1 Tax=Ramlibacter rhizophilus TaxID=1781167 RepID=A0A4Z0BSS5_9BURK|nr:Bug family tripartite tricarboxylate transporter substrate binding protein [Ramlibacter rhizophilus]TFZ01480.1 ABC transporter substrate-binding protein [Ramlibacter rhizophilus]